VPFALGNCFAHQERTAIFFDGPPLLDAGCKCVKGRSQLITKLCNHCQSFSPQTGNFVKVGSATIARITQNWQVLMSRGFLCENGFPRVNLSNPRTALPWLEMLEFELAKTARSRVRLVSQPNGCFNQPHSCVNHTMGTAGMPFFLHSQNEKRFSRNGPQSDRDSGSEGGLSWPRSGQTFLQIVGSPVSLYPIKKGIKLPIRTLFRFPG
jgi:hypothetical protein